jgi:hypothetical protein
VHYGRGKRERQRVDVDIYIGIFGSGQCGANADTGIII